MSVGAKSVPYRGSLTVMQVADGMNAAIDNAQRLAVDARLLLGSERWPTAASLAALSIEESGKVAILRRFLTEPPESVQVLWKEYRTHAKKNLNWILPDLVAKGARRLEELRPIVDGSSDHPQVLDAVKQIGFYTDCFVEGRWSTPSAVVDEALAKSLVATAEVLVPRAPVSVRELELWIEHLGPVWNMHVEWMKQGLVNWYAAMQREGLAPAGTNQMGSFIRDGLTERQASRTEADP
jgi:AbiV family abortive infection protein